VQSEILLCSDYVYDEMISICLTDVFLDIVYSEKIDEKKKKREPTGERDQAQHSCPDKNKDMIKVHSAVLQALIP